MGFIIFNGTSSKNKGIEVEHPPKYGIPEVDCDVVHVPGRNGDVIINKGNYKNVPAEYDLSAGDGETGHSTLARTITKWLHTAKNYARLEDSYDPDIYRMAMYKESGDIENIYGLGARVTVKFDCKPQRWLKTGETPVSCPSGTTLVNPTDEKAKPLIKVVARGPGSINIGDYQLNLKGAQIATSAQSGISKVDIDSSKFMTAIGSSADNMFDFINLGVDLTVDGSKAVGISNVTVDENTFITATGLDSEGEYNFIFVEKDAAISSLTSESITDIAIRDKTSFLEQFQTAGEYTAINTGRDYVYIDPESSFSTVTIDANTYRNQFNSYGFRENAYKPAKFTYDSSVESWKDSSGYAIVPADYGITITGTPANGDFFVSHLLTNWSVTGPSIAQATEYGNIFNFDGYPLSGDIVTFTRTVDSWAYWQDTSVVVESGFDIATYGITFTGTPINGDVIKITANPDWTYDGNDISLTTYGISYSGNAKIGAQIIVVLNNQMTIDCEEYDCFTTNVSRNNEVEFVNGWPVLVPGNNLITFNGGINSVEVTPRWWTL